MIARSRDNLRRRRNAMPSRARLWLFIVLIAAVLVPSVAFAAYASDGQNVTLARYEQTGVDIAYLGTWVTFKTSGTSSGSYKYADSPATAVISFTGTQLDLIVTKGLTMGKARVTVDGAVSSLVDLYSSSALRQQRVWSTGRLADGAHTVTISWTGQASGGGTRVNIDAVEVAGTLTQATLKTVEQNDYRLSYAGSWKSSSSTSASGGSYFSASSSSSSAMVAFTGTDIRYVAQTGPSAGQARLTLDGGTPVYVDLYSSSTRYKQVLWSAFGLNPSNHLLRIEWTGKKNSRSKGTAVNVDALMLLESAAQATSSGATTSTTSTTTTVQPTTTTSATSTTTTSSESTTTTSSESTTTTSSESTTTTNVPAEATTTTTMFASVPATPPPTGRVFYVDATGGNDSNSGTSPTTAWKTMGKINSTPFLAGDTILFKRGEIWRDAFSWTSSNTSNGSAGKPITFGAYGTGAKPKWTIAQDLSSAGAWTSTGSNLWRSVKVPSDPGNIIMDNEAVIAHKKTALASVLAQGDFYYDYANDYVVMYSAVNPGNYYSHIEAALRGSTQQGIGGHRLAGLRHFITFENLDIRYAGLQGLYYGNGSDHITVQDVDFSWIGGAPTSEGGSYRDGNGIMIEHGISDSIIRRCTFSNVWEVSVSVQSWSPAVQDIRRLYIYDNIIRYTHRNAFEVWYSSTALPSTIDSLYFVNNTLYRISDSAGLHAQDPSYNHPAIRWATNAGIKSGFPTHTVTNVRVENNITNVNVNGWYVYVDWGQAADYPAGLTIDYNLYYEDGPSKFLTADAISHPFSWWQGNTRFDKHSMVANPLFANPQAGDFSLQAGSPALDSGIYIPETSSGSTPSRGARR